MIGLTLLEWIDCLPEPLRTAAMLGLICVMIVIGMVSLAFVFALVPEKLWERGDPDPWP